MKRIHTRALTLALLLNLLLLALPRSSHSSKPFEGTAEPLSIGFIVGANPDAIVNQWYPMVIYLQEALGRPVKIVLRDSYEDMVAGCRDGSVDIPVAGPFNYVKTSREIDVRLIAGAKRPGEMELKSAIVVRADSPYERIADLKGGTFAFTDIYSTAGYLAPRIELAKQGIRQPADFFDSVVFAGHHTASLDAVLDRRADAGAMASYFVDESAPRFRRQLRTIWKSAPLPPEPMLARPGLDERTVSSVRDALLSMHDRVPQDVMARLNLERFVPVTEQTYEPVRRYAAMLDELPVLPYTVDYGRAPAQLVAAEERYSRMGLAYIFVFPAVLALGAGTLWLAMRRRIVRRLRLKLALSIAAAMILVALAVSAINAANMNRRVSNTSLRWQRIMAAFSSDLSERAGRLSPALLQSMVRGLARQDGVLYAKILRNGEYIADSQGRDAGHSVVQKIIAGTFRRGSDGGNAIDVFANLASGGSRYAIAQIGLDADRLEQDILSAAVGNAFAVAAVVALGFALAVYWSRLVSKPIVELGRAVSQIRSGRHAAVSSHGRVDEIGELMNGFAEMERGLRSADEMLMLKSNEFEAMEERLRALEDYELDFEETGEKGEGQDADSIHEAIDRCVNRAVSQPEDADLKQKIDSIEEEMPTLSRLRASTIIGESPAFLKVIRDIVIRSRDTDPVLIYGESGSGKTGVAGAIHALGARRERRMVEYNCAELAAADPTIVLGKLFGYGRECGIQGVPKEGQRGLLEECDGATLFLDEIALLPKSTQGAMLLPLEGRPFNVAAGKAAPKRVDVRFIFASNQRLEDEVRAGRFRNDLLRRIRARGVIEIPPLRDRMADIDQLATHFIEIWRQDKGMPMDFSADALELLKKYDYRNFNVAELAIAIKVAADNTHFRGGDKIKPDSFGDELGDVYRRQMEMSDADIFDTEEAEELVALRKHAFKIAPSEAELGLSKEARTLSNHLRGLSFKVLAHTGWNTEEASQALAGQRAPLDAKERVKRKMELYLRNLTRLVKEGNEKRLFNNLPAKYHAYVNEAIGARRNVS